MLETRGQKWEGRSGNQKRELEARGQKQEVRIGSLKVSSLPSFHFFWVVLLNVLLQIR